MQNFIQVGMDLKKVQKQGRNERTQEDYHTVGQEVLLHGFHGCGHTAKLKFTNKIYTSSLTCDTRPARPFQSTLRLLDILLSSSRASILLSTVSSTCIYCTSR